MDVTYIPMATGFVYLVPVVGWYTRRLLACRISLTLDGQFCLKAVEDAMLCKGKPEIMNADQAVSLPVTPSQCFSRLKTIPSA